MTSWLVLLKAMEREERTMRRQMRRAEIDAKRLKLLEVRAKQRETRKNALLARKQRDAKEKRDQAKNEPKPEVAAVPAAVVVTEKSDVESKTEAGRRLEYLRH